MKTVSKNQKFKCQFKSGDDKTNEKVFNVLDVFEISTQPANLVDITSGNSATYDIAVTTDSSNTVKYEWTKKGDATVLNSATDVSKLTIAKVLYDNDKDNKYKCKVTWKSDHQELVTVSNEASIEIIQSCEVVKSLNAKTTVDPDISYVRNNVNVKTTCNKGSLLPIGKNTLYSQTCEVQKAIQIENCVDGCYVDSPGTLDTYHGTFSFTDTEKLVETGYTTVHHDTKVTISCSTGYVVDSNTATNEKTCKSGSGISMLDFTTTCKLGCKLVPNDFAVYTDTDGLIAPQTTQAYTCKDRTITKEGKTTATSAQCGNNGGDIKLDACHEVTFTKPAEKKSSSSVILTLSPPVLKDTDGSKPAVQSYKCEVTEADVTSGKLKIDTAEATKPECVISNLLSNTKYKYVITVTFTGGATWVTQEKYEFTTDKPKSDIPDAEGKLELDIPQVENPADTYDLLAVWFKDPTQKNSNLEVNIVSRRKRDTPVKIDNNNLFEDFKKLESSGKPHGAFYAKKGIPKSEVKVAPSTLPLPKGETFVLAAYLCEKDNENNCFVGSGTSYVSPKDNTMIIVISVVVVVVVLGLVGGLFLVYKRRPDLFAKRSKPATDHTVFQNPQNPQLEEGNEITEIERRIPDPIHVADFLSKYRRLMQDTEYLLDREYDEIKCEVPPSNFNYLHAKQPENKIKNRYVDIIPYDETRVKLRTSPEHPSDYINACYVTNMSDQLEFIAAQGPKEETKDDFWQMVWENKSLSIVMVTNLVEKGRKKCAQYWSDESSMQYGSILVTVDGILTFPDYCIRTLIVERGQERRCVYHFHYLIWPDHGAPPTTSLIDFCRRCFSEMVDGPVVVHCSAGVGRTGTLMALHLQMRMLADEQRVDLFGIVCRLRRCRKLMVQTSVQYKFLYQAIREMIICDDTFIAVRDFNQELARLTTPRSGNQYMTLLDDQFKRLEEYCTIHITQDKSEFKTNSGSSGVNHNKNRFSNVLPFDSNRVKLRVTTGETGSDYINASYINSYHERDAFIATQGPKPNTIGDFWRMIFEKEVSTIVMLTPLVDRGRERCTMYWPRDKEDPICVENITVYLLNVANPTSEYTVRTFSISIKNREEETTRQVKQYHYYTWTNTESPASGKPLIKMIDQIKNSRRTGPVVVHCSAGIGRTAVFMAVHNCIEQLRQDEMIDLFTIVLRLRLQRNGMVQSMDQYAFCYRVMAEVCSMFDDYVNTQGMQGR